jgi:hypothetical protein
MTEGQTLTIWFGDRSHEFICEEAGRDVVLIKNRSGPGDPPRKASFLGCDDGQLCGS